MTMNKDLKREAAIKATAQGTRLTLDFAGGETIVIDTRELSPEIAGRAMLHGLKQKLVDAAAISRNPDTGRSATIEDKYEAVKAVQRRLMSGSWNEIREGGSNTSGGLLFRALRQLHPTKDPAALKAWLETKTDKEKAAMRSNAKIASVISELQAERPDANAVDSDALLDELDA